MEAHDLFRRLSAGAKFDRNRFFNDALKFKVCNLHLALETVCHQYSFNLLSVFRQLAKPKSLLPLPPSEPVKELNGPSDIEEKDETNDTEQVDPKAEIRALRKARKKKDKTPKELAALKKEEINRKRKAHQIHVQGSDIPSPVET